MADDPNNFLTSILSSLEQKKGEKGVIKDSDGKVSPSLTPEESSRYKNIFQIMKDVIEPDPEAANVKSTRAAQVGSTAQIQAAASGGGGGSGFGLGPFLAAAGAAGLLATYLKGLKDKLAAMFGDDKIAGATGILRGMVSLKGIFAMLSALGKILQPLTKGFELLKNSKAFKSIGGTAAKMIKVGSKIGKMAGSLFKMVGSISKTIGKKLKFIPFLGSIFNFITAYEAFQSW